MPIVVTCSCGQRFAAKDELAGKRLKCPKCGGAIQVPAASESRPAPTPAATTPAAKPPAAPAPVSSIADILDEVEKERYKNQPRCIRCEAVLPVGETLCPKCGFDAKWMPKEEQPKEKPKPKYKEPAYDYSSGGGGGYSGGDDELTGLEYVACFCCSGITCIVGIVYLATGNPKGPKLIMWSIIFSVIKNLIGFAIQAGTGGLPQQ